MTRSITAVLFSAGLAFTGFAQNMQTQYVQSLCIKVEPEKVAQFNKFHADTKPVFQARADAGEFSARVWLGAVYPAGMAATCDFMAVTLYPGFPPDPKSVMSLDSALQKAHLPMKASEYVETRGSTSRLRKSELWRHVDGFGNAEPGNYVRVDYMKVQPNNFADWMKMEREIYKPVHQARMEMGGVKGWVLATMVMPGGSSSPFNAMTVNIYKDWAQVGKPVNYTDAFKKAFPDKDAAQLTSRTASLRDIVRSELFEVLEVTTRSGAPSGAPR